MKKTLIAAITALTLTAGAISGVVYAHSKSPERAVERMTERLNLNEEQQMQLKELYEQRMLNYKNMKEGATAEQREEMYKNGREEMRAQMESQIKALLNDDQIAVYDQMHADKDHKSGHHKGGDDCSERGEYGKGKGHHYKGDHDDDHDEKHEGDHMKHHDSDRHHS